MKIIMPLLACLTFSIVGCSRGSDNENCSSIVNEKDRNQCIAHRESTAPRGPSVLPPNPKKY